jgi:hypothetical protein
MVVVVGGGRLNIAAGKPHPRCPLLRRCHSPGNPPSIGLQGRDWWETRSAHLIYIV